MPKRIQPLTAVQIRTAKPLSKETKLFDGGGLYLLVTPSGGKLWRLKYTFAKKEKKLAFGAYPEISLAQAREERQKARELIAQGIVTPLRRNMRSRRRRRPLRPLPENGTWSMQSTGSWAVPGKS